jgi:hypothetical protein
MQSSSPVRRVPELGSFGQVPRAMRHKHYLVRIIVSAVVLTIVALALTSRPLRIWYHRMRLRHDMSFVPVLPKSRTDYMNYWRWRLLESGLSQEKQIEKRQGIDAPRQTETLVELGYYSRSEFGLRVPWSAFEEDAQWVKKLGDKAMQNVISNGADWPDIRYSKSPSNTILIQITAPVSVVQEWARVVHEHETDP